MIIFLLKNSFSGFFYYKEKTKKDNNNNKKKKEKKRYTQIGRLLNDGVMKIERTNDNYDNEIYIKRAITR